MEQAIFLKLAKCRENSVCCFFFFFNILWRNINGVMVPLGGLKSFFRRVSIILSTPWIFSSLWGEYFQRGWWEFLTARLLPPAWLNRAYQSVTTFDSLDGSWRAEGWGVGVRRVSGGAEVISRGWRLLLILILVLILPLFEKRTWTFWSVFPGLWFFSPS